MVGIGVRVFFQGRFTSAAGFLSTYLPFAVILGLYYMLASF